MAEIVRAFTAGQELEVCRLLGSLVRPLRTIGGKLEEDYWAQIYRKAKGLPPGTWSNLQFNDIIHRGLGVESKLLKRARPFGDQGRSLMHPAATRRIVFDPSRPAEECKDRVLEQWAEDIRGFQVRVRATSPDNSADLRWGLLLWADDLSQFLYFEERITVPRRQDYRGEWGEGQHRGRASRNLHIYERATGKKRYSVTLPEKGAKLQPYFDIPTRAQGAHLIEVPLEDLRPLWVATETYESIIAMKPGCDGSVDDVIRNLLARRTR